MTNGNGRSNTKVAEDSEGRAANRLTKQATAPRGRGKQGRGQAQPKDRPNYSKPQSRTSGGSKSEVVDELEF